MIRTLMTVTHLRNEQFFFSFILSLSTIIIIMESSDQLSFRQKIFNGTINALKRNMDDFIGVDLSGFTEIETG